MNASIHTTLKIHVTSVTRVTSSAKRPDSLAFNPVTLQHAIPYTRCNAHRLCNATSSLLPAAGRHSHLAMAPISLATPPTRRAWDNAMHFESHWHD